MAVSDLDVINGALLQLGAPVISAIGEDSVAGELAQATYEVIRDRVLASHPWGFATRRVKLVETTAPDDGAGFQRAFKLPADHLRVVNVIGARDQDWVVEHDELLTDIAGDVFARYIAQITEAGRFSAPFVEALQSVIAAEWAETLTSSNSLSQRADRISDHKMRVSRSFDGQESAMQKVEHYSWTEER